jgi:hypothetical protein
MLIENVYGHKFEHLTSYKLHFFYTLLNSLLELFSLTSSDKKEFKKKLHIIMLIGK